jgi:nitrate reductase gamma subunit
MRSLFFIVLPYVAFTLAILAGLYRYFTNRFSYSSLSSELLEKRQLFWGSVPWHYGIILILLAHLLAGLFPGDAAAVLGGRIRLVALEMIGMSLGLFTIVGLAVLIVRRLRSKSLTRATSPMDWILLGLLVLQVLSGLGIAMFARWGSLWYLDTAVPWMRSIFSFQPDASTVVPLSGFIKLHMVNGFILILLFPFTRLVHIFTVPISYLWRPYQLVIWNRRSQRRADQETAAL